MLQAIIDRDPGDEHVTRLRSFNPFAGVVEISRYREDTRIDLACGHVSTEGDPIANFIGYIRFSDSSMFECNRCHHVTRVKWVN